MHKVNRRNENDANAHSSTTLANSVGSVLTHSRNSGHMASPLATPKSLASLGTSYVRETLGEIMLRQLITFYN